jgi:hypothetical protein
MTPGQLFLESAREDRPVVIAQPRRLDRLDAVIAAVTNKTLAHWDDHIGSGKPCVQPGRPG